MAAPTRLEIMKTNPNIGIPSNKAATNPNTVKERTSAQEKKSEGGVASNLPR